METWADEVPLYIWSGKERADLEPLRAAKARLDEEWQREWGQPYPQKVKPFGVMSLTDLPDLSARVMAIGSRPPFICDYALLSERTSPEGWHRALLWVLGINEFDEKATTIEDVLGSIFPPNPDTGAVVMEIPPELIEGEKRFADYLAGRV